MNLCVLYQYDKIFIAVIEIEKYSIKATIR